MYEKMRLAKKLFFFDNLKQKARLNKKSRTSLRGLPISRANSEESEIAQA